MNLRGLFRSLQAVSADLADGFMDLLAGAPGVSPQLAAAIASSKTRAEFLGPYIHDPQIGDVAEQFGTIAEMAGVDIDPDRLHHGCFDLRICLTHNTVSVVKPTEGCPLCDPTSADNEPAEDSPAATSDGLATTAPAAGHSDPLHEAAAADGRITNALNRFGLGHSGPSLL